MDPYAAARAIIQDSYALIHKEEQLKGALALTFEQRAQESSQRFDAQVSRIQTVRNRLDSLLAQLADQPLPDAIDQLNNVFSQVETEEDVLQSELLCPHGTSVIQKVWHLVSPRLALSRFGCS